ncbi:pyridoxamine 5'-phosphate oxidase family protein [Streptomyces sp. V3I7]|uniref:pyridoxamine 5'-phosphate oxidase family protein n=1 Tax=Streptomyces sp. V3I7 TaxID=3042278 RepID=UPI00278129BC|nr:pyridoxamine 5'-phosphate oxidase family protein [Streptomyces sp. V3I7]MDQ0992801.1 nitroimidazol reductase NimA-like FMN-containing flavoprotein (pyridoxamine 5'-phosphate oxidase superfamily) [Streptomyces sp. V3I7]
MPASQPQPHPHPHPHPHAQEPRTDLDARYSSPGATAMPWSEAVPRLENAEIFWLSTVRPDGRPHVTPLMAVWLDGALHFSTGARERKGLNLAANPHVVLSTGTNTYGEGCDLVIEGEAVRVTDEKRLAELAAAWEAKYGPGWHFEVRDGGFGTAGTTSAPPPTEESEDAGRAVVFRVDPRTAFGFGRDEGFSQTRWRFTD